MRRLFSLLIGLIIIACTVDDDILKKEVSLERNSWNNLECVDEFIQVPQNIEEVIIDMFNDDSSNIIPYYGKFIETYNVKGIKVENLPDNDNKFDFDFESLLYRIQVINHKTGQVIEEGCINYLGYFNMTTRLNKRVSYQLVFVDYPEIENKQIIFNNTNNNNMGILTINSGAFNSPAAIDPNTIDWSSEPAYSTLIPVETDPVPAYLVPFNDPQTGAKITRVGDQVAFGETGAQVGHNYSSNAAWNSDGSLIKLNVSPARIISDADYSVVYTRSLPAWDQWSNTNPNLIYGIRNDNEFTVLDVTTGVETTLYTFAGYTNVSNGQGEGRISVDDKYICFTANVGAVQWLISFDIELNSIIAEIALPSGNLDHAEISNSGDYVLVHWVTDGNAANEGLKAYDRDLTNLRHLKDNTGHGDCGTDINGNEVWVQFHDDLGGSNTYLEMIRLTDGTVNGLYFDTSTPLPRGVWGGHVSCRNLNRPGWAYISEAEASLDVMANEIFAIKLSPSENLVERYGKHHATPQSDGTGYNFEARACVNRDGNKIIFDSAWNNNTLNTWNHAPAWVLEWI